MVLTHPYMLWLLLAIPATWLLQWRATRKSWTRRTWLITALRSLSLLLMVFALARPVVSAMQTEQTVVAVADISPSISSASITQIASDIAAIAHQYPKAKHHAVIVSDHAQILPFKEASDPRTLAAHHSAAAKEQGTALADGLLLASSVIPSNAPGKVILYTDGHETRGDALLAVHRLADRGIIVDIKSLAPDTNQLAFIESQTVPASAGLASSVTAELHINAKRQMQASVQIQPSTGPASQMSIPLQQGDNAIALPVAVRNPGINTFDIRVQLPDEQAPLLSHFSIMGLTPPKVVVIETAGRQHASRALTALLGSSAIVESQSPEYLQNSSYSADMVVLANVPASAMNAQSQQNLRDAVARGTGLFLTGGPESFGPGGYGQSSLAELIPLSMNQQQDKPDPSVALVVIIDTSASMAGARIALAKEVVRITMQRMSPHDKIGIVEFYGSKRWAAPIQSAANSLELNRALNRLTAGGGTLIYPALEEAFFALKSVNARSKHVLILTDGGVETGPFEAISRQMADNGMTVSTVLTGPGQHSNFLASIAQWGRGHFYQVPDLFSVPEIQLKQPSSQKQSPLVEKPSQLISAGKSSVISGIDFSSAPAITGYVRTGFKPTADTILQSSNGDPILTSWRFGRGKVAAFTSSLGGSWMQSAQNWPQSATLFSNLVRAIAAKPASDSLELTPMVRADSLQLSIRALLDSHAVDALTLTVSDRDGKQVRRVIADPISAGRWDVLFRNLPAADYQITASGQSSALRGSAAITLLPRAESVSFEPNASLFKQIADESVRAQNAAAHMAPQNLEYRELWPLLALFSLIGLIANVLVRRLPPEKLAMAKNANTQTLPKEQYV